MRIVFSSWVTYLVIGTLFSAATVQNEKDLKEMMLNLQSSPKLAGVLSASTNGNQMVQDNLAFFLQNKNGYSELVQNQPILLTSIYVITGSMGNHLGNYFELISCAKLSGLHFLGFPMEETKKQFFFEKLPTLIYNPNPAPSYSDAVTNVKKHCPESGFPWQSTVTAWSQNADDISLIMNYVIDSYLSRQYPQGQEIQLATFDTLDPVSSERLAASLQGGKDSKSGFSTPLIPDAAILVRCNDIIHHASWMSPYGILNFLTYPMVIPNTAKSIYIVAEPKEYGHFGEVCNSILLALIDFLHAHYPNAIVGLRRGNAFDSIVMLSRSFVSVCPPSTFCLWPAIAAFKFDSETIPPAKHVKYIYESWLFANDRPIYIGPNFHWVNFPRFLQFGDEFTKEELMGGLCCEIGSQLFNGACCKEALKGISSKLISQLKSIRPPGPRVASTNISVPVTYSDPLPPLGLSSSGNNRLGGVEDCPFNNRQPPSSFFCEILTSIKVLPRRLDKPFQVLLLGVECGSANSDSEAKNAKLLKQFLNNTQVWAAEHTNSISIPTASNCAGKLKNDGVDHTYVGDQSSPAFLQIFSQEVSGGQFDLVVDNATSNSGKNVHVVIRSFEILWPQLGPGGWYVVESMRNDFHHFSKLIAGWTEELACGEALSCNSNLGAKIDFKYASNKPQDMGAIRCVGSICGFQKKTNFTVLDHHHNGRLRVRKRH